MNRKKKRLIERAHRNEIIREIIVALQKEGGVIYLKKPMTVWVDEIFGELPVTVNKSSWTMPSPRFRMDSQSETNTPTYIWIQIHLEN